MITCFNEALKRKNIFILFLIMEYAVKFLLKFVKHFVYLYKNENILLNKKKDIVFKIL